MATIKTATATVQDAPTAKTKLGIVESTPTSRVLVDTFTSEAAVSANDLILVRRVQGGSKILPTQSDVIEATGASAITLDIGIYEVAAGGGLGAEVDGDILADGVDFAGSGVFSLRPYDVPTTKNEYWIVAKVVSLTGTIGLGETIDFYTAINSAN